MEEVKISFKWHDASKKGGTASVQSIAFERACTMYNLAARDDNNTMLNLLLPRQFQELNFNFKLSSNHLFAIKY